MTAINWTKKNNRLKIAKLMQTKCLGPPRTTAFGTYYVANENTTVDDIGHKIALTKRAAKKIKVTLATRA
jgi:hypothetical protein